jgi:hypothetical protein
MCHAVQREEKKENEISRKTDDLTWHVPKYREMSVIGMTCWKWFNGVLKEAGVEVTTKNEKKVDDVIHKYIGEQSSYGHCSADWRKARKEIEADPKMKGELVKKLQSSA